MAHSRSPYAEIVRQPAFRRLWVARMSSALGEWLVVLALMTALAFDARGSAGSVAALLFMYAVPMALFGSVAGSFVDRWSLKRTLVAADFIRAATILALGALGPHARFYLLPFALSIVGAFAAAAQFAVIPRIVGSGAPLLSANALMLLTTQVSKVVGPAAAATMVGVLGHVWCLRIGALALLLSGVLLTSLPAVARTTPHPAHRRPIRLDEGLRAIWTQPVLRWAVITMAVMMAGSGMIDSVAPLYVRDELGGNPTLLGLIIGVIGAGTIAGGALLGNFARSVSRRSLLMAGIASLAVGVATLAIARAWTTSIAAAFILGMSVAAVLIASQTLLQEFAPADALGRVGGTANSISTAAMLVGMAIAGLVTPLVGVRSLYMGVAALLVATSVVAAAASGWSSASSMEKSIRRTRSSSG